jgi:hypothetical protein
MGEWDVMTYDARDNAFRLMEREAGGMFATRKEALRS